MEKKVFYVTSKIYIYIYIYIIKKLNEKKNKKTSIYIG